MSSIIPHLRSLISACLLLLTVASAATAATLHEPYGVAVDKTGRVYVTNLTANTVTVYNKARTLVGTITGGMNVPEAIAIGAAGNVYVANTLGNNITTYGPDFKQTATITDSLLQNPIQMFVDRNNDVWVLDTPGVAHLYLDDHQMINYEYLPGITAIAPWDSASGNAWTAWSTDGSGNHLATYQNIGEALHFGLSNLAGFTNVPSAVAVAQDAQGNLYVVDATRTMVWLVAADFSSATQLIATVAPVYGIAVDSVNKRVYLTEPTLGQVAVWSTSPIKLLGNIK